jgi:predicted PurR-regulated permease PerM
MRIIDAITSSAIGRRRLALLLSLIVAVILLALMWRFVSVLVPYGLSAIIAFLVMPVVDLLASRLPGHRRRPRVVRAVAAALVMIVVLIVGLAVIALAVFRLVSGTAALAERVPGLVNELQVTLTLVEETYRERVPLDVQAAIDPRIESAGSAILSAVSDAALQAVGVLQRGLTLVIALAGAPIILFYLLYDPSGIGRATSNLLPGPLRHDLSSMGRVAGVVVIAYIRTQVLMGIMVSVVIGLALWGLGIPAAVVLGVAAGLGELIPVVGPVLGFAVAAVVVLVTNPTMLPVIAVLYLAVQLLQNTLIMPRLQGQATGLHPLAVMLSLAVMGLLLGFWGVLIAVPLVAAAHRVLSYARAEWYSISPGDAETGFLDPGQSQADPPDAAEPAAVAPGNPDSADR